MTANPDLEELSSHLTRRNGQLGRLLYRLAGIDLPRGMGSLLGAVDEGPQALTRLAEREGLAQPTVTRMVQRLEEQGLVRREGDPDDARRAMVTITPRGSEELAGIRARYTAVLTERLADMSQRDLLRVAAATEALQLLIDALQRDLTPPRDARPRSRRRDAT